MVDASSVVVMAGYCVRAAAISGVFLLAGCAGGFDLRKAEVDRSILTGSIEPAAKPQSATRVSDEATIRNLVTSADVEMAATQPLSWANTATGSRGTITKLTERDDKGLLCRSFTASRESFDGVGLYAGDACRTRGGAWQMRSFKPL